MPLSMDISLTFLTGAGAFGAVVLLSSGTRRRYGTYNDPNDSSMCMMLNLGFGLTHKSRITTVVPFLKMSP